MKKPLIFDFCTSRRNDDEKAIYYYDYNENLNLVNLNGQALPFVEFGANFLEMITKTSTHREGDDENNTIYGLTTLLTEVAREGSDEDSKMLCGLVESQTETRVMREGTDVDLCNRSILELMTKTDVVRERDDEQ